MMDFFGFKFFFSLGFFLIFVFLKHILLTYNMHIEVFHKLNTPMYPAPR